MMQKVKDTLFSLHGAIVTVLHLAIVGGFLSGYVFFRLEVMGDESVSVAYPNSQTMKRGK